MYLLEKSGYNFNPNTQNLNRGIYLYEHLTITVEKVQTICSEN